MLPGFNSVIPVAESLSRTTNVWGNGARWRREVIASRLDADPADNCNRVKWALHQCGRSGGLQAGVPTSLGYGAGAATILRGAQRL